MGYRASRHASTKQSPYHMLFQWLSIDAEIIPQSSEQQDDLDTVVDALLESREKAFEKVQVNMSKAQKQQKETYDRKRMKEELKVGREVLLENTAQQQRKGSQLECAPTRSTGMWGKAYKQPR